MVQPPACPTVPQCQHAHDTQPPPLCSSDTRSPPAQRKLYPPCIIDTRCVSWMSLRPPRRRGSAAPVPADGWAAAKPLSHSPGLRQLGRAWTSEPPVPSAEGTLPPPPRAAGRRLPCSYLPRAKHTSPPCTSSSQGVRPGSFKFNGLKGV